MSGVRIDEGDGQTVPLTEVEKQVAVPAQTYPTLQTTAPPTAAPPKPKPNPNTSTTAPSLSQITAILRGQPVAPDVVNVQAPQLGAAAAVAAAETAKGGTLTTAQSSKAAKAGAAAVAPGTGLTAAGKAAAAAAGKATITGTGAGSTCGAGSTPLIHMAFVNAIEAECDLYDVDVLACAANAIGEGIGGGIGDGGYAYGPWQDHLTEFSDRPWYGCGTFTKTVNEWAWSADGITYSIRQMDTGGAHGKTGHAAVAAIVTGYEKPADIPTAISNRNAIYDDLKSRGTGWKAYVASLANGPSGVVVAPSLPEVAPAQETKASGAFQAAMKWLAVTVPQRGTTLTGLASTIPTAIASELWSPST